MPRCARVRRARAAHERVSFGDRDHEVDGGAVAGGAAAGRGRLREHGAGVLARLLALRGIRRPVALGAVAGLIGMPAFFGADHSYGLNFQEGVGFIGIGIALLGRNHPVGIAFAALLWSWLEKASDGLQLRADVSPALVFIIQGVILLAVVIAYEVVARFERRLEQKQVTRQLDASVTTEGATA